MFFFYLLHIIDVKNLLISLLSYFIMFYYVMIWLLIFISGCFSSLYPYPSSSWLPFQISRRRQLFRSPRAKLPEEGRLRLPRFQYFPCRPTLVVHPFHIALPNHDAVLPGSAAALSSRRRPARCLSLSRGSLARPSPFAA